MSLSDDAAANWHPARLIPTAGIKGQEEQERRATSSLLAVLVAVPEFAESLLSQVGAPKGRVSTYVEVQLKDGAGKVHIPDGVITVERGKTRWAALVEVKTGDGVLGADQVTRYVDMARQHGFQAVLTLSTAITSSPEDLPYTLDKRKLRSVPVRHLSWWRVITEAVVQHRYRGISDPDQAWILGELIAYMDHQASGCSGFTDMGASWVSARDAAHNGTLRAADPEAAEVASRWEQFSDYIALGLAQDLGADVVVARPRGSTPDQRHQAAVRDLVDSGCLRAQLKIPDAVAPLNVTADLRAKRTLTSVTVRAPEDGRAQTRINWLLKQLKDAPDDLRIEVVFAGTRETTSVLLGQARELPACLLLASDPKREPKRFVLELGRKLGTKRGRGRGTFVTDTKQHAVDFYADIMQGLSEWRPKAPRLREPEVATDVASADPPSVSGNGRDPGEAVLPRV